jgi:hypothetical protein
MPQDELNTIINFLIPIILVIIAIAFVWWKFGEPLTKLWELIKGVFVSGKDKTVQTYQNSREIVYDI